MNENQKVVFDVINYYVEERELNTMQAIYWSLTTSLEYPDSEFATAFKKLSQAEVNIVLAECIKNKVVEELQLCMNTHIEIGTVNHKKIDDQTKIMTH